MLRALAAFALTMVTAHLGGCATPDTSALTGSHVPAERYTRTFQAARDVLREYRFTTDRVDAPQGVLTSLPRTSPGIGRPWEAHSGSEAAWVDTINFQQRAVQVVFVTGTVPARQEGGRLLPPTDPDRDLAQSPQDTTMLIRVTVDRVERDGRRVSADSVRIERQAIDPAMQQSGNWPRYLVQEPDDKVLAATLLRLIVARSETPQATAQPAAPTPLPADPAPTAP